MPAKPGKKGAYVCEVDMEKIAVPDTLRQMYLQVNITHKEYYLHAFLLTDTNVEKSLIIFCNRASTAQCMKAPSICNLVALTCSMQIFTTY